MGFRPPCLSWDGKRQQQDYEAVLVDESGTIWLTPGLKDRFIPVDQGETREIRVFSLTK